MSTNDHKTPDGVDSGSVVPRGPVLAPARAPGAARVVRPAPAVDGHADGSAEVLERFLQTAWHRHGLDLRWYSRPTLDRRLGRRLMQLGIRSLDRYLEYLQHSPTELDQLRCLVRIRNTAFFRDRHAWEVMRTEVLPRLLRERGTARGLRIWVAGCATGEEAYSLAILLAEQIGGQQPPLQVYATDIDREALAVARRAQYSRDALKEVPEELQRRYFHGERRVQVDARIRQMVVFGEADLLRTPGLCHLDLIVCRNVLIYFDQANRGRVLAQFCNALHAGGVLWLGASESGLMADARLLALYPRWRIFQKPANPEPGLPLGVSTREDTMSSTHPVLPATTSPAPPAGFNAAEAAALGTMVQLEEPRPGGTLDGKREGWEPMRMVNERLESAIQELQATNETLAATNEELKTMNEELERMNEELEARSRELRQLSQCYSDTLDRMPCPVLLVGKSGKVRLWNEAAQRLFNLVPAAVVGLDLSQLPLSPALKQSLVRKYRAAVERSTPVVLKNQVVQAHRAAPQRYNVHLSSVSRESAEEGVLIVFLPQGAAGGVVTLDRAHKFMHGTAS